MIQKITQLINCIEAVKLKNRDLLSVDDLRILDETVEELLLLKNLENKKAIVEYSGLALQVILNLLRFFRGD